MRIYSLMYLCVVFFVYWFLEGAFSSGFAAVSREKFYCDFHQGLLVPELNGIHSSLPWWTVQLSISSVKVFQHEGKKLGKEGWNNCLLFLTVLKVFWRNYLFSLKKKLLISLINKMTLSIFNNLILSHSFSDNCVVI